MRRMCATVIVILFGGWPSCKGNIDDDTFALSVTIRVSRSSSGQESNGHSTDPSFFGGDARYISADGRFVAFVSEATNLVPGDTNGVDDIFVRDTHLGTTVRASFDPSGAEFVDDAANPVISADGRYVAFECFSTLTIDRQIYRRDLLLGITELVSETTTGAISDERCFHPSISADGRFVAFETPARLLVSPPDPSGLNFDVFVRDMTIPATSPGATQRASAMPDGSEPSGHSYNAAISADGRYVAFTSDVTGLAGPFNGNGAIYVRDMSDTTTFTTVRVSVGFGGVDTNAISDVCSISADGSFVAFESTADNILAPAQDANAASDIFVWSRATDTISRVSVHTTGTESQTNGSGSTRCSISGDGRIVAFVSDSFNLVSGDVNQADDIFVHDRLLNITFRASVRTFGEPTLLNENSRAPSVSLNGQFVAFESEATNLVDDDLNGQIDVFLRGTIP